MDFHSNLERNWQQFTLLAKAITERSGVPEHLYEGFSYHPSSGRQASDVR